MSNLFLHNVHSIYHKGGVLDSSSDNPVSTHALIFLDDVVYLVPAIEFIKTPEGNLETRNLITQNPNNPLEADVEILPDSKVFSINVSNIASMSPKSITAADVAKYNAARGIKEDSQNNSSEYLTFRFLHPEDLIGFIQVPDKTGKNWTFCVSKIKQRLDNGNNKNLFLAHMRTFDENNLYVTDKKGNSYYNVALKVSAGKNPTPKEFTQVSQPLQELVPIIQTKLDELKAKNIQTNSMPYQRTDAHQVNHSIESAAAKNAVTIDKVIDQTQSVSKGQSKSFGGPSYGGSKKTNYSFSKSKESK